MKVGKIRWKRKLDESVFGLDIDNTEHVSFLFPRAPCRAAEGGRVAPLEFVVDVWAVLVSFLSR